MVPLDNTLLVMHAFRKPKTNFIKKLQEGIP